MQQSVYCMLRCKVKILCASLKEFVSERANLHWQFKTVACSGVCKCGCELDLSVRREMFLFS